MRMPLFYRTAGIRVSPGRREGDTLRSAFWLRILARQATR
jgi:hypothetical protein